MNHSKHKKFIVTTIIALVTFIILFFFLPQRLIDKDEYISDIVIFSIFPEDLKIEKGMSEEKKQFVIDSLLNCRYRRVFLEQNDKTNTARILISIGRKNNSAARTMILYLNDELCWIENYKFTDWELLGTVNLYNVISK